MRVIMCLLMLQCGPDGGRAAGVVPGPGITLDGSTSTGDGFELRLDLPGSEWLPDLPGETTGSSTGEPAPESTGPDTTGEASSTGQSDPGSTGGSTGDGSTSSTGGTSSGSSSTGEPPPAPDVCDDGTCGPDEAALPCYGGNGWCFADCAKAPHCITDCPCAGPWLPGQSQDQVCHLAPGSCSATKPGGYCDPNGDGAYLDANFTRGFLEWGAKCKP